MLRVCATALDKASARIAIKAEIRFSISMISMIPSIVLQGLMRPTLFMMPQKKSGTQIDLSPAQCFSRW
jgi:hypothetical protein